MYAMNRQGWQDMTRRAFGGSGLRRSYARSALLAAVAAAALVQPAQAHIFIFANQRAGAPACSNGVGWKVEAWYGFADEYAVNLLAAEGYAAAHEPDFTFHATYIDWPMGPTTFMYDTEFETLGDFLNGHISELSDPDVLDLPFDHFLLRATGYVYIRLEDSSYYFDEPPPPIYYDIGLVASDGGRVYLDPTTLFRMLFPEPPNGFMSEDAVCDFPGLYPLEVTYLQRHDPANQFGADQAGVELLACRTDGLPLPSGELLRFRCQTGPGYGMPPAAVFQTDQLEPVIDGDFDVDGDVDLEDLKYWQSCYTGPDFNGNMNYGCTVLDFDNDRDVDLEDYAYFFDQVTGPNGCH